MSGVLEMFSLKRTWLAATVVLALTLVLLTPIMASAQPADPAPNTTCTDFEGNRVNVDPSTPNTEPGILTNITEFISEVIGEASRELFQTFTDSPAYQNTVNAAATLMIIFYAVAFTTGIVNATFGQVLVRLVKLGLIYTLISPAGWNFFSDYVVRFFNDGTDQIIGEVISIGTGIPFNAGDSPFLILDGMARYILSSDMIIAIMGTFGAGQSYGAMMGFLLAFACLGFIQLVVKGLKLYAISFIVRALLFGVAPVFIVFLLFEKTKPLFSGWVNILVNTSLQPILYFTFISFFLVMMMGAARDMLGANDLCWAQTKFVDGTSNTAAFWKFKQFGETFPRATESNWRGPLECAINGQQCTEFPINIVDILAFVILVYVAMQFAQVVEAIAHELSNAAIHMSTDAKRDFKSDIRSGGGDNVNTGRAPPSTRR